MNAFWSPAGKGLASCLSFVMYNCEVVTFPLYLGSDVVLDCIDSLSLPSFLLFMQTKHLCVLIRIRAKDESAVKLV